MSLETEKENQDKRNKKKYIYRMRATMFPFSLITFYVLHGKKKMMGNNRTACSDIYEGVISLSRGLRVPVIASQITAAAVGLPQRSYREIREW